MKTMKTTVYAKDTNFKMYPDFMGDNLSNRDLDWDCTAIPEAAKYVVGMSVDGETAFGYVIDGVIYMVNGFDEESIVADFPLKHEYMESTLYLSDEKIEGSFNDIIAKVYGSDKAAEAFGVREKYEVVLLTEPTELDKDTEILIVEEFGMDRYHLLVRDGKLWLDKTRKLVKYDEDTLLVKSVTNFNHHEDLTYTRNMAKFFQ